MQKLAWSSYAEIYYLAMSTKRLEENVIYANTIPNLPNLLVLEKKRGSQELLAQDCNPKELW